VDPVTGLALKFLEQGGLYVVLGLYLLQCGATYLVVRRLYADCQRHQQVHMDDLRAVGTDAVRAMDAQRAANESATRAAEANYTLTTSQGTLLGALGDAVENLTRAVMDRRR
jgi:hypothetical protein